MGRAARRGHTSAQVYYGILRFQGKGVDPNEAEAADWFERAATAGNPVAMNRLARVYAYGRGREQDYAAAAGWHLIARTLGVSDLNLDQIVDSLDEETMAEARKSGREPRLGPDSKSQVTLKYENGKPVAVDALVLSTQHNPDISQADLKEAVMELIVKHVIPAEWITKDTQFHINPTGNFVIGGPVGDCGLTGRKIIVDTYGGMARHGGGAFSGKDPSKVDRSAAYAGRYVAKNIVAAGLADRCEIQVSYAIGVAEPTSVSINTFGTGKISDDKIIELVREHFDLRPYAITTMLDLLHPMYKATAAYGHFGRDPYEMTVGNDTFTAFTWERTDKADALRAAAGL